MACRRIHARPSGRGAPAPAAANPAAEQGQRRTRLPAPPKNSVPSLPAPCCGSGDSRARCEAGADQFLRHAQGIVGPMAARGSAWPISSRPIRRILPAILGIDAQFPVARRTGSHVGSHVERHRKHEAQIVVGMFANQIDAARGAENADAIRGSVEPPERVDQYCSVPRPATPAAAEKRRTPACSARIKVHIGGGQRRAHIPARKAPSPIRMRPTRVKKPARRHSQSPYYRNQIFRITSTTTTIAPTARGRLIPAYVARAEFWSSRKPGLAAPSRCLAW